MAAVSALATVALVFTDALFRGQAGVTAATAGALSVAALLALAAALAPGLGGEVNLFIVAIRWRQSRARRLGLLARWGQRRGRHGPVANDGQGYRGLLDLGRTSGARGLLRLGGFAGLGADGSSLVLRTARQRSLRLLCDVLGAVLLGAVLVVGIVAASLGVALGKEVAFGGMEDLAHSARGVELLTTSLGQLILALALAIARSAGGGGGVGSTAECVIQSGRGGSTMRDV